jgi:hypothetical protein
MDYKTYGKSRVLKDTGIKRHRNQKTQDLKVATTNNIMFLKF